MQNNKSGNENKLECILERAMAKTDTCGRIVMHSSGKILVYDCACWSNKISSMIQFRYPNLMVSVEQNLSSLSGYVIVLEEKDVKYVFLRLTISVIVGSMAFCTLYTLHNSEYFVQFFDSIFAFDLWNAWALVKYACGLFHFY